MPAAEFNFYHDPEAVFIVLNYLKCPITILTLETDENLYLTMVGIIWVGSIIYSVEKEIK